MRNVGAKGWGFVVTRPEPWQGPTWVTVPPSPSGTGNSRHKPSLVADDQRGRFPWCSRTFVASDRLNTDVRALRGRDYDVGPRRLIDELDCAAPSIWDALIQPGNAACSNAIAVALEAASSAFHRSRISASGASRPANCARYSARSAWRVETGTEPASRRASAIRSASLPVALPSRASASWIDRQSDVTSAWRVAKAMSNSARTIPGR